MRESSVENRRMPPAWAEVVKYLGGVSVPVLNGVRHELASRRGRRVMLMVQIACGGVAAAVEYRYPRPRSADQELVIATVREASDNGRLDLEELRGDPAFRAAHDRVKRQSALVALYGAGMMVGQQVLLAVLMRQGVRRPRLIVGLTLAAVHTAYRMGMFVADNRG